MAAVERSNERTPLIRNRAASSAAAAEAEETAASGSAFFSGIGALLLLVDSISMDQTDAGLAV